MSYELVAAGHLLDITQLVDYDELLPEGGRGLLELELRAPVPGDVVTELQSRLNKAGVEEARVETGSPLLRGYFRKGLPWLAVIAAAVLGMIALALLVVGWKLFREVASAAPAAFNWLLVAGAAVLAIALTRGRK